MGIEYVYNNKCIYMNYNLLINRVFLLQLVIFALYETQKVTINT